MLQHLTIARIAEGLAVAWNTANTAVLAEGHRLLILDEHRFDGVTTIGVDDSPALRSQRKYPQRLASHQ